MSGSRRKKQKTTATNKDASSDHEDLTVPSSLMWSTRQLHSSHIPPLSTLCIRLFALNFTALSTKGTAWNSMKRQLQFVPEALMPRLLASLRESCPTYLTHEFISTYLLRGPTLALGDDLPGVKKATILAITRSGSCDILRVMDLRGLREIHDDAFASVICKLPNLRVLGLRECTKVGPRTVEAAATSCPQLDTVNFSYTAVTPISLASLIRNCKSLRVLKVAGMGNWTDANVSKLWSELTTSTDEAFLLPNLQTLKLRQTSVTDLSLAPFLRACPNLRRLDVSFTGVRRPPLLLNNTTLEKLSLTSTKISSPDLLKVVTGMTSLKTLSIGALGRGEGSAAAVYNTTAMTLTDDTLCKLTDKLSNFNRLENVNIAGNLKLGAVSQYALVDFVAKVGRNCKNLNLAGLSFFRSRNLQGLLHDEDQERPSPLESLVLNNTNIDDNAAVYISCCTSLRVLELSSTKITSAGLLTILDACKKLERLNLTSCRGIDVAHRRNFFEVYERERHK